MVLSGGGRFASIIASRTNTCGGNNKSGLPSRIGTVTSRLTISCNNTCNQIPKTCVISNNSFRLYYRPGRKYLG